MSKNELKIGENIRYHRKRLGLTQTELAEKLFVTPQNVSKWEKGLSLPGTLLLIRLSECFGISLDGLVGKNGSCPEKLFLAIDGGGTKTEFCLFSQSGKILNRKTLAGTNPNSCGIENTKRVLSDGITDILSENADICSVFAGIAGCGSEEWQKAVRCHIKRLCPNSVCGVGSDIANVIASCPAQDNFAAAICGTGSVILLKHGDSIERFGGFGYLFDKELSGYTLGCEAIREALASESGISSYSLVSKLVEAKLGAKASDSISRLYSEGKDYIASFSHAVFDAYRLGDKTAASIIGKLVSNTAVLLDSAVKSGKPVEKVVFSGGLCAEKEILLPFLEKETNGRYVFCFNELPQIFGASVLCAEQYDKELVTVQFKNRLTKELEGKSSEK